MAENISSNTEDLYPDNNSNMKLEADAFLNAIAGGADEEQADEAAFLATNPDGIIVDDNGEVLESGVNSKIKKGEKVEFIDDEADGDAAEKKEMPSLNEVRDDNEVGHDNLQEGVNIAETSEVANDDKISDDEEIGDESLVTFDDLGLSPEILEAVKLAGY